MLIAVDGVHYAGRGMDRSDVVLKLRRELPSVRRLIVLSSPDASGTAALDAADVTVAEILRRIFIPGAQPEPVLVPVYVPRPGVRRRG